MFSALTTTKAGLVALAQLGQQAEERAAAETADDVADEEDVGGRVGHCAECGR